MVKLIKKLKFPFFTLVLLPLLLILIGLPIYLKITSSSYDEKVNHSKVTLELIYESGNKVEKSFIVQSKNINSFQILRRGSGVFTDGYPILKVFKNYNSWSGDYKCIEPYVISFKIVKVENY